MGGHGAAAAGDGRTANGRGVSGHSRLPQTRNLPHSAFVTCHPYVAPAPGLRRSWGCWERKKAVLCQRLWLLCAR